MSTAERVRVAEAGDHGEVFAEIREMREVGWEGVVASRVHWDERGWIESERHADTNHSAWCGVWFAGWLLCGQHRLEHG
ncbi:MAG: hypothetical protein RIS92_1108 [Verrucomicrobiota bacterium]